MGSVIDSAVKIGSFGLIDTDISGKKAGENALNAQTNAAREAADRQREALKSQTAEMQPWKDAGLKALERLQNGNLTMDPGYQFRLAEGNKAINAAASARGNFDSGRALKELSRYGQDYASGEYQNAWNRDNAIANYGNNASTNLANFQGGFGASQAQNAIGLGNANAANSIGQANRDSSMVGQGIGLGAMALGGGFGGGGKMSPAVSGGMATQMGGNPYSLGGGIDSKYLAFSDMRLKTNIQEVPVNQLKEMKKHLQALSFGYIDNKFGDGEWVGVMAQSLNKSKMGRTLTFLDNDGNWQLNLPKILSLFLAYMAVDK